MERNTNEELEHMELEKDIYVIRQDLKGDALKSAHLIQAAQEKNWQEVEKLLEEGADPRICRETSPVGERVSALYLALASNQHELARKLFEAGDRLDDLRLGTSPFYSLRGDVLDFLAFEMRKGNNYFYDESKSFSECCRCAAFMQIDEMLETASQDELSKSIEFVVDHYCRSKSSYFLELLKELIARGGKLSDQEKEKQLGYVELCRRWPAVMRPSDEGLSEVTSLIKQA
jgi:hypothetical protein